MDHEAPTNSFSVILIFLLEEIDQCYNGIFLTSEIDIYSKRGLSICLHYRSRAAASY